MKPDGLTTEGFLLITVSVPELAVAAVLGSLLFPWVAVAVVPVSLPEAWLCCSGPHPFGRLPNPDSVGGHRNGCRHRNSRCHRQRPWCGRAARTVFDDCLGWETCRLMRESAGAPRFPPRSCSVGVPSVDLGLSAPSRRPSEIENWNTGEK